MLHTVTFQFHVDFQKKKIVDSPNLFITSACLYICAYVKLYEKFWLAGLEMNQVDLDEIIIYYWFV